MNKQMLRKLLWTRVRLRPIAKRFNGKHGEELGQIDGVWIIKRYTKHGVEIENDTSHSFILGHDHIRNWASDGEGRGFLNLTVQVNVGGDKVWMEPNVRRVSN